MKKVMVYCYDMGLCILLLLSERIIKLLEWLYNIKRFLFFDVGWAFTKL